MSDSNSPWWRQYRLQKYKPPVKLNIEMILRKSIDDTFTEYLKHVSLHSVKWVTEAPLFILASYPTIGEEYLNMLAGHGHIVQTLPAHYKSCLDHLIKPSPALIQVLQASVTDHDGVLLTLACSKSLSSRKLL